MNEWITRIWIGSLCLFLAGCAGTPTTSPGAVNSPQTLENWQLNAKLAVRDAHDGAIVFMQWKQQGDDYQIELSGSLGQQTTYLYGNSEQATLIRANGSKHIAKHPETLFVQSFGFAVPFSAMKDWVRGLPAHALPLDKTQLDAQGDVIELGQSGWDITYQNYLIIDGYRLPERFEISHDNLRIKGFIQTWTLPPQNLNSTTQTD